MRGIKGRARVYPGMIHKLSREEVQQGKSLVDVELPPLPKSRSECVDGPRPCPFVRCRYHLKTDITKHGSLICNDLREGDSCALDVADRGSHSLEYLSRIYNITREAIRLIEKQAIYRFLANARRLGIDPRDMLEAATVEKNRHPLAIMQDEDADGYLGSTIVRNGINKFLADKPSFAGSCRSQYAKVKDNRRARDTTCKVQEKT